MGRAGRELLGNRETCIQAPKKEEYIHEGRKYSQHNTERLRSLWKILKATNTQLIGLTEGEG